MQTVRVTTVLLGFRDGRAKEFVQGVHIHGFRDGELLLATGTPGAGLDAEVVRRVPVAELGLAETCPDAEAVDAAGDEASDWTLRWE
jgi:hypothetical protein